MKKSIIQKIKNFENEEKSKEIFDEINFEIISNLQDTFSRFKFTDKYQQWKKKMELNKKFQFHSDSKKKQLNIKSSKIEENDINIQDSPIGTPSLPKDLIEKKDIILENLDVKHEIEIHNLRKN